MPFNADDNVVVLKIIKLETSQIPIVTVWFDMKNKHICMI